jgi:hypothetical protein
VRGRQILLQALDLGGGFVRPSILTARAYVAGSVCHVFP